MTKFHNFFQNFYKKILVLGLGIVGLSGVSAQNLSNPGDIYTQNFNTGANLAALNFTTADSNTDNTIWALRTTETFQNGTSANIARGGTGSCAAYRWNPTNAANDWLFSPALTLKANNQYRIRYYFANYGGFPEKMKFFVGTGNTAAAYTTGANPPAPLFDHTSINNTSGNQSDTYTLQEITFTPTADGTYYMVWQAYSDADQWLLRLDDISIENVTPVANDVSVTEVTTTATTPNCGSFTASTTFSIKVRNTGTNSQTNIPVNFSATRNGVALAAIPAQNIASLDANAETTLTVNIDATSGGTYILTATTALANDGNVNNNSRSLTILNPLANLTAAGANYQQGFEGANATLATFGWTSLDSNSDTQQWQTFANASFSRTGSNFAVCFRSNVNVSNDWLITNCMQLQGGSTYRVTYYRRANGGTEEKIRTFWGNAPTVAAMTNEIGTEQTFSQNSYVETIFTFTPANTGTYYIGFQQTSAATATNGTNGIMIDDFSIINVPAADIAIKRIMPPFPNTCGGFTATTPITARIWNAGTAPVSTANFTFKYQVRDATATNANPTTGIIVAPTTITVPAQTIAVGDSLTLPAFNVNMSVPRFYVLDVFIDSPSTDLNKLNDTTRIGLRNSLRDLSTDNANYTENFNGNASDRAWVGLNQSTVTGTGAPVNWAHSTATGLGFGGSGGFFWAWPGTAAPANATLFSPCLNLVTGKVYSVNFKYRLDVAGTAKVRMLLVNATTAAGITSGTLIKDYPSLTNLTYVTATDETFTVPNNGTYFIAFQLYSDADAEQPALIIDDFSITNTGNLQPSVAPASLTATPATLAINLSWPASTSSGVTAPTSYRLDVSTTDANTGFSTLFTTPNNTTLTYAHTGLTAGTTYFYRVYSINSVGASTGFAAASATPNSIPAPTNLTLATQTTGNQLRLNWTASAGATGYEVERVTIVGGNPQGSYAQVGTPTTNTFTNTGLTTGTVYRYRVRATIGANASAYSNEVTSAAVLSVENNEVSKQITLSPNPNDGNFNLNVKEAKINKVQFIVSDINGKVVYTATGQNEDSFDFKLTNLPAGNYTLSIDSDKGKAVKRFIIK